MRVFALRLQLHQIHDVDDADLQRREMLTKQIHGGQRLQRRHVAATGHHDIWLAPLSLLAHSQIPMPAVQCLIAWSIVSHCGAGCLPATTTFT